jgi:hypothetical protein
MTLFEYLAIAFSLVFSFAAVRLVGGLPAALARERRYWVHLSFVFHELFRVAAGFWAFWSLRETEWTFPAYLLALVGPGLVYFAAMACWALVTAVATTVLIGMPWSHPFRLVQLAFVGLGLVGAVFESERLHAGLAAVALALPAMAMLTVLSRPGSLAN